MSLEGVEILESNYFRVRNDLKTPSHPVSCPMWNPHLLSLSWHQTFAWIQMTTGNATLKGTYSIAGLEKRLPSMSGIWNLLQLLHPEGDHLQRGPLIQPPALRARANWWDVTLKPQQEDFTSEKRKKNKQWFFTWTGFTTQVSPLFATTPSVLAGHLSASYPRSQPPGITGKRRQPWKYRGFGHCTQQQHVPLAQRSGE